MSPPTLPLRTPRLVVRLAEEADAPAVARYFTLNRAFLEPWEPRRIEAFYTTQFWREQLRESQRDAAEERALRLFLFDRRDEGRVLGTAHFSGIMRGALYGCYLGYSVAESAQGKGLMREALAPAIAYLFESLNLHRVMANYQPHNRRSARLLRALGFAVEGYARDYLFINGEWTDHVLTSLLNPRWHP